MVDDRLQQQPQYGSRDIPIQLINTGKERDELLHDLALLNVARARLRQELGDENTPMIIFNPEHSERLLNLGITIPETRRVYMGDATNVRVFLTAQEIADIAQQQLAVGIRADAADYGIKTRSIAFFAYQQTAQGLTFEATIQHYTSRRDRLAPDLDEARKMNAGLEFTRSQQRGYAATSSLLTARGIPHLLGTIR